MLTSTLPQCRTIRLALCYGSLLYLVIFRKPDNELHNQIVSSNACLNKHTRLQSEPNSRYAKSRQRQVLGSTRICDFFFFLALPVRICCACCAKSPLGVFQEIRLPRTVEGAALLLQAYITSRKLWREHSQAAHTHVNPDVGLGGACGWLLSQEEQITREELQFWLVCDH